MTDLWPQLTAARINLADEADFDLGAMRVLPSQRAVEIDGQKEELQPRVMQVLVALKRASPAVVSREKLIELCWAGRSVGDDAINRCVLALRHLAQRFDPPAFEIETVPRIGHRLVDHAAEDNAKKRAASADGKPRRWRSFALAAVLFGVIISGLLLWQRQSPAEPASIAVLPFRNLSAGDPYFAEGIGEEILAQLAREPAFRVAGRASSAEFTGESDPREVGRKLNVDYVLEGSVRSDQGRVRVSASLMQAKDGMRLWSDSYDRSLQDVFEIQSAIGQAVAGELKRRLVRTLPKRSAKGEAYALYLNARGLMRSLNPQSGPEAVTLLEQAVRQDPGFAPAWASLADAILLEGRTKGPDGMIAVLPRAERAVSRALKLDPNLAEAHVVMGQLLGGETPQAVAYYRRAAELNPGSVDAQISAAIGHEVSGEYAASLSALRRARTLDPLSPLPLRSLIGVATTMGERKEAEQVARTGFPDKSTQDFALSRIAWFSGDYSEAMRHWSALSGKPGDRWARPSRISLDDARFMLGQSPARPDNPTQPILGSSRLVRIARVWMTTPPSPQEWRNRNRSLGASLVYYDENVVAAKLMLGAGRAGELVDTYDGPFGLLSIRKGRQIGPCQLDEVPLVALALRRVGRVTEADALLNEAERLIRTVSARGRVPHWFQEDAAGVWAVQGKAVPAIAALKRAQDMGWMHAGRTDLPSLADEPAFQPLRNVEGFQAAIVRQRAHYARERNEIAAVLKRAA